ncbi:hypothetical protein X798_00778 [Onchocerca flexuosa]|uniref:Uncharacterized protein n=1 Tax=Onchocerca flexuosa TaxID=387005 RepID=A0A238C478_9BILA|nr:hypothetical protein X798_00778 [Onchocerca flexuosa]
MNNSMLGYSRDQLQNATGQIYIRPIVKSSKFSATKRTSHTLPKAISPFLQSFDNDEREERPITVTPKLRSTRRSTTITTTTTTTTTVMPIITTITVTSPTPYPILLSRLSSATHVDETKRDKVQV